VNYELEVTMLPLLNSQLLASTGDGEHWWVIAPFFWALWLAVLGTVLYFVLRGRGRRRHGNDHAKAILAERFARGEISSGEFKERLEALS
jgi:putative membrane protein